MLFISLKVIITAIIIVIVSEIVKINDRVGGLIAALPFTTFLILFWMHFENILVHFEIFRCILTIF